jgi:hypothetical protein
MDWLRRLVASRSVPRVLLEVRSAPFTSDGGRALPTPTRKVLFLRVLPVLEKGEVHATALRSWERGTSSRWHIHCAIELPSHLDAVALENLIRACWAKVELGYSRILIRDCADAGWINYMLKDRQEKK